MKSSTRHRFSPSTSGLTSFEVRDAMEITYGGSTVGWRALISAESGCFNVVIVSLAVMFTLGTIYDH